MLRFAVLYLSLSSFRLINFFPCLPLSVFYFLYYSIKDEKDSQNMMLEKTKEEESLRNSSLVLGARVSVSHSLGRLMKWKKSKTKMMIINLLNNLNSLDFNLKNAFS